MKNINKETSVCLATLFLANDSKSTAKAIRSVLTELNAEGAVSEVDRKIELNIKGVDMEKFAAIFQKKICALLDLDKQSSMFYRSKDGAIESYLLGETMLRIG